jgi:GNAT superfamily N-acetyltransferase
MDLRPARPDDVPAIIALATLLAEFEKLPPPDAEAVARLTEDAFGRGRLELWVATTGDEAAGEVAAYAATFMTYSTFHCRPTLFLEDLFVRPDRRRQGVARAMLARLEEEAVRRGCARFEWLVLDWNQDARDLYESYGARAHESWRLYRVELPRPIRNAGP